MKYDLVFEGGGAKGMVFVGALQEFEARGHTYDRLLGTSAGAITAALLAAGYTSQEMLAALNERENNKPVFVGFLGTPGGFSQETIRNSVTYTFLQSIDIPVVPEFVENAADQWLIDALMKQPGYCNLFSFVEEGGWYSAHKFLEWLQVKLDTGIAQGQPRHFSRMSLAEFFAATGFELSVVAADTTAERMLVLNHTTAPDCPLVWAVRMSMSIPLVWPEVEWQASWGTYRGQEMAGHLIVDGGLLSNFPLELFISDQPHVTAVMGPKKSENILGLLIDEALAVEDVLAKTSLEPALDFRQLRTARRIMRLINTVTQAHDKMVIEAFEQYVVRLPARDYGTTEFDMSDERREALITAGHKKTHQYFEVQSGKVTTLAEDLSGRLDLAAYADRIATRILSR
jgi:predicted acylesterase/phospholipase RssA